MTASIDPAAFHRVVLKNGLTVLLYRNTAAPVVAINTYVKAGYFDETDDVIGIAHVLEHMFFKGTTRRGVGEIAKATKAVGGFLNAHTIYDHTSYYTVLPASGFAEGLDIQADAYANSIIDAKELAKELEVIIQEAKRKEDNPGAVTTETLYALLHDAHRIRRWRIGREAPLRALTREQLLRFYRNFYTPSNTILSIAGDIDIPEALQRVEALYGPLADHAPQRTPGPSEPEHTGLRYQELSGDVAQVQIDFGWRTVAVTHPDTPALDLAASVLGAGRASRLYRAVRERKLAGSVSAYNFSPMEVGVFVMSAECEPTTTTAAAQAMWEQVRSLRDEGVTPDEIERCKQLFASRWARRLETTEGQAAHFAEWEVVGGWQAGDAYYARFMALTPSDVADVARRYLAPDRVGAVVYRPEHHPPFAADASAFSALLQAAPSEPLEAAPQTSPPLASAPTVVSPAERVAGVHVYRTPNDIPVLVSARPGASITYIGVHAIGGAVYEPADCAGLSTLVARTSIKGTTTRSAMQIAATAELLGGSVSPSVGAEHFGWSISVPRDNTMAALALLADVVQHATLSDDAIATERTVLRSDLAQLRDDMYRYPLRLATTRAFAGHPYGKPASGTDVSLQAITPDDVRRWYRDVMCRAPFVIGVVGDVDPDVMASAVAGEFGELVMTPAAPMTAPEWPQGIVESAEQREKAQTALVLAFPSPARQDPDRFAVHLLTTIASGLGGRFFDELRDRQSLAYTVHAFASEYQHAGMLVAYIATSPGREGVARDGLLREFEKLREGLVSDEELVRAKRYVLGMHDIRQERGGAVLNEMMDAWSSGTGLHELTDFAERVHAVTAADIQRLARHYFDPERRVEGIVRGVSP